MMSKSVMPKGVEHAWVLVVLRPQGLHVEAGDAERRGARRSAGLGLGQRLDRMSKSVMPKGVEHRFSRRCTAAGARMSKSVMPKGVEHRRKPSCSSRLGACRSQ